MWLPAQGRRTVGAVWPLVLWELYSSAPKDSVSHPRACRAAILFFEYFWILFLLIFSFQEPTLPKLPWKSQVRRGCWRYSRGKFASTHRHTHTQHAFFGDGCYVVFLLFSQQYFPDRFVRRDINALEITCVYQPQGCVWEGTFSKLEVNSLWGKIIARSQKMASQSC